MQNELIAIREHLEHIDDPVALLQGIVAYSPLAFHIFKTNGQSLLTNRAFRNLFGAVPPPAYNVFQDEILEAYGLLDLFRRAFAGETVTTPPIWYDPRDLKHIHQTEGRRIAIECTCFPLYDRQQVLSHIAMVYKDVTGELKARQDTEAERDLLRLIIDQSGDGIIVADENGVLRIVNPEAQRQHGTPMQEVSPAEWRAVYRLFKLDETPMPLEEIPLYRALHGERVKQGQWITQAPRGARMLTGTATPLVRQDGTSAGAVLITRDETEKLKALRDLETANQELKLAVSARDDFLSIASHELRTPLTSLYLQIQSLHTMLGESGEFSGADKIRKRVEAAGRSLDRMNTLVNNLLDISRISSGRLELTRAETNLSDIVHEVVLRFQDQLKKQACRLELAVAPHVVGQWDASRLDQIVTNLLSNAIKYGPGKPVHIGLEAEQGRARLTVRDEGIGIEPELQAQIFERFERAVSERSYGGFGLGLWIVRQIAEAHGGSVAVQSEPDAGATFTVTLPLAAA